MNPPAWSVDDFLGFYVLLISGVLLASVPLYEWLRLPGGPPAPEHLDLEPYQVALLIGRKETRVAAVVQLVQSGALRIQDGLLHGAGPLASSAHPLEKAFHAAVLQGVTDRKGLLRAAEPELARMEDALRQRGLLMASKPLQRMDTLGHLPLFAVAGLGFVKLGRELPRGRPLGFLLLFLTLLFLGAPALPQDKELQGYLAREYTQPGDAT